MSEEIKEEIEALLSIYEDDMEVLKEKPNYVISMNVRSMNEIEGCPTVTLKITYPDGYPNELAEIEFDEEDYENFEDEDLSDLKKTLHETMDENRGDVMTFLVISAAIEWLELNHTQKEELKEQRLRAEKDAADAILTKKLIGTKVTVENFMAWKTEFDFKRLQGKEVKKKQDKLTGKELFLQNSTLNDSDLKFISSEDNVEFDEDLFDDLDGLDIDDDLE